MAVNLRLFHWNSVCSEKMIEDVYKASYTPSPSQVEKLFKFSQSIAKNAKSEMDWYNKVKEKALHWLE